jgi:hypothetical protein
MSGNTIVQTNTVMREEDGTPYGEYQVRLMRMEFPSPNGTHWYVDCRDMSEGSYIFSEDMFIDYSTAHACYEALVQENQGIRDLLGECMGIIPHRREACFSYNCDVCHSGDLGFGEWNRNN